MPTLADVDAPDLDARTVADEIAAALHAHGDPERAGKERTYLHSELEFFGTGVPTTRRVVRASLDAHPGVSHDEVVALAEALWAEPVHERRLAAVELLSACTAELSADDVALLERLLRDSRTWALVDPLAIGVVGALADRDDGATHLGGMLDRWATDDDVWIRRSALLALLVPLRRGEGDWDRFSRYASAMADERDVRIRKAVGWVLRETGKRRPELVVEWVRPRAADLSGVTWREAIKPLSPAQVAELAALRNRS